MIYLLICQVSFFSPYFSFWKLKWLQAKVCSYYLLTDFLFRFTCAFVDLIFSICFFCYSSIHNFHCSEHFFSVNNCIWARVLFFMLRLILQTHSVKNCWQGVCLQKKTLRCVGIFFFPVSPPFPLSLLFCHYHHLVIVYNFLNNL